VAKARGMAQVAKDGGLGRESLYKALAPGAHPRFATIVAILRALGVQLAIRPAAPAPKVAPAAVRRAQRRPEGARRARLRGFADAVGLARMAPVRGDDGRAGGEPDRVSGAGGGRVLSLLPLGEWLEMRLAPAKIGHLVGRARWARLPRRLGRHRSKHD
jgi:hypothetical protein